jgi:NADH-ubiquinone oxidoreductase chain 2
LLALSINSVESVQSFIFYLIQYSISNLNAFFLLISIGYTLFIFINKNINSINLLDKNNSPIQLLSQIKGYFFVNRTLAISLAITIFSFAGIPPLLGFFAKFMFLYLNSYEFSKSLINLKIPAQIIKNNNITDIIYLKSSQISLSNSLSITISILTLIILLFIFIPDQ